ncbi:MAG: 7TM diverse intracellular signaling domain-containing protein [bacterium]|nr:7TM diverse intracellular signaling domain-containing protein [bacterium]
MFFYGLFYGAAALMAIYHFLIYFTLKEKSLLLYSGMVTSMLFGAFFRDGHHNYFLTPEQSSFQLSIQGTAMVALWLFMLLQYFQSLTNPTSQFPALRWPLRIWGYLILVIAVGFATYPVTFGYAINLAIVLTFLAILPINLWQFKGGNKMAGWFGITLLFNLGAVMLDMLRTQGVITSNTLTRFGPFALIFLEFIILAWVMSRRFNRRLVALVERKTEELREKNEILEVRSAALNEYATKLRSALQFKDKTISIIAHDLRGPIGSILVIFRMVKEGKLTLESQLIDQIFSNLSNLRHLLENLLQWALNQQDHLKVQAEVFDLLEPVEEVLELFRPTAQQKQIELIAEVPRGFQVNADRTMIMTVLRNLINNALKFTKLGGQIVLRAQEAGPFVRFEIRDTGVGIAAQRVPNLFEANHSVISNGTQGERGNGLGLLLVREFIEANGGQVGVESQEGVGSSFWFTLPRSSQKDSPTPRLKNLPPNLRDFLVVEDNPLHQATTKSVLSHLGACCELAPDGEEALERAQRRNYSAILVDIDLPGINGVEVARAIRQMDRQTHILAVTGYSQLEVEKKFGTAPFAAYLKKPLEREELLAKLAQLTS